MFLGFVRRFVLTLLPFWLSSASWVCESSCCLRRVCVGVRVVFGVLFVVDVRVVVGARVIGWCGLNEDCFAWRVGSSQGEQTGPSTKSDTSTATLLVVSTAITCFFTGYPRE